jgi:transposase-like protein
LSPGATVAEASKRIMITEQTYYRWRDEYGGMKVSQAASGSFQSLINVADA